MLTSFLAENDLDGVVFFHLPNIRYLCGFTGTDGALVATPGRTVFLTDSRYTTQARRQVRADEVSEYRQKIEGVAEFLRETGVRRCGFEATTLAYGLWSKLREKVGSDCELVPLDDAVDRLRRIKSDVEVAALLRAAGLHRRAFDEVRTMIRPGVTERQIALELEISLKRFGAEEKAFDFIVASGERGAMPHGVASDRAIGEGELVTIDFGVRLDGYHSDETITLAVGEISSDLRRIYDIVLAAHDAALEAVTPGMSLRALDAVARDLIAAEGYGDFFGHGLGHGVGLEIHEYPAISPRAEGLVEAGMVLTIEPGIYVPGLGGVRIEDMVRVTDDGCEILTRLPKAFNRLV
ncbi:Xaa-Pro aminopeptidase/Xaa-Pro dipeptidase [Geothermobacter ehrlichii]|uniref:Xaa-Pro aminopeptidase/Xaa-Pro dipeptidase n=1 Tax=Geothermobacter ehrlichii TaxID=213224 RepID=A0A5D3WP37_9BACT|nr:Xaa-Pro peptidase family protein [Geothermobacter ehrlichii]TYO99966.1 Xaa-Pro aminopeptidase/Xaa-Pro dipeptidase [Geothermobacter ehrlichii]